MFDRAAPTYDRIGEAYHAYFAERLIDLAAPARDAQLLDVACGRGAVLHRGGGARRSAGSPGSTCRRP